MPIIPRSPVRQGLNISGTEQTRFADVSGLSEGMFSLGQNLHKLEEERQASENKTLLTQLTNDLSNDLRESKMTLSKREKADAVGIVKGEGQRLQELEPKFLERIPDGPHKADLEATFRGIYASKAASHLDELAGHEVRESKKYDLQVEDIYAANTIKDFAAMPPGSYTIANLLSMAKSLGEFPRDELRGKQFADALVTEGLKAQAWQNPVEVIKFVEANEKEIAKQLGSTDSYNKLMTELRAVEQRKREDDRFNRVQQELAEKKYDDGLVNNALGVYFNDVKNGTSNFNAAYISNLPKFYDEKRKAALEALYQNRTRFAITMEERAANDELREGLLKYITNREVVNDDNFIKGFKATGNIKLFETLRQSHRSEKMSIENQISSLKLQTGVVLGLNNPAALTEQYITGLGMNAQDTLTLHSLALRLKQNARISAILTDAEVDWVEYASLDSQIAQHKEKGADPSALVDRILRVTNVKITPNQAEKLIDRATSLTRADSRMDTANRILEEARQNYVFDPENAESNSIIYGKLKYQLDLYNSDPNIKDKDPIQWAKDALMGMERQSKLMIKFKSILNSTFGTNFDTREISLPESMTYTVPPILEQNPDIKTYIDERFKKAGISKPTLADYNHALEAIRKHVSETATGGSLPDFGGSAP